MGLVDRAPVPAAQVERRLGARSAQADYRSMGDDEVGHLLHPAPGLLAAGELHRSPAGHLLDDLGSAPGGA